MVLLTAVLYGNFKEWIRSEDVRSVFNPFAEMIGPFLGSSFSLIRPLILPAAVLGNLWLIYFFVKMIFFEESEIDTTKSYNFDVKNTIFQLIGGTFIMIAAGTFYEKRYFEQDGNLLALNIILVALMLAIASYYWMVEAIFYKFRIIKDNFELNELLNEDRISHLKKLRKQSEIMILIMTFGLFILVFSAVPYINNFSVMDMSIDCLLNVTFFLILPSYFIIRKYVATSEKFYIIVPIGVNGLIFTYALASGMADGLVKAPDGYYWLNIAGIFFQLILMIYLYWLNSKQSNSQK